MKPDLSKRVYVDPKGFFKITPPEGWRITEYPTDPRGKVALTSADLRAEIRSLAQWTGAGDLEALLDGLRQVERSLGVRIPMQRISFCGIPAVKRTVTLIRMGISLRFLWIDFLQGRIAHNIQYSALSEDFETYLPAALQSIGTYTPCQPAEPPSQETLARHTAAAWRRGASLAAEKERLRTLGKRAGSKIKA